MNKTQSSETRYPYRKNAKALFIITFLFGGLGVFLYLSNEQDPIAAALVAWLPASAVLITGLSLYWWDGKDSGDGGSSAPGPM